MPPGEVARSRIWLSNHESSVLGRRYSVYFSRARHIVGAVLIVSKPPQGAPEPIEITEAEFTSGRSTRINSITSQELGSNTPASSTLESPPSPIPFAEAIQSTADDFLSDLSNYLPLGCFSLECHGGPDSHRSDVAHTWQEVFRAEEVLEKAHPCFNSYDILLCARWVRMFYLVKNQVVVVRIYVLPDDVGRRYVERLDRRLRQALRMVISTLDISSASWDINLVSTPSGFADDADEDASLFYLFNKLPSPSPVATNVKDKYTRRAMESLLNIESTIQGLKTPLYPYQRRSAAMMLQREISPGLELDPRLLKHVAPDGSTFYYDKEDCLIFRTPRCYESARGGILAETMGLGKTLICLAVILASKEHWPQIPVEFSQDLLPTRTSTGSLVEMCASAIGRHSLPWRSYYEHSGNSQCLREMQQNVGTYEIPGPVPRSLRPASTVAEPRKIRLCTGTLIIVPNNLLVQWRSEIVKHTEEESLKILVVDGRKPLPQSDELSTFDVVLFSRTRWEREIRDGQDAEGRRQSKGKQASCSCTYIGATRDRNCQCFNVENVYRSPLKDLHWLRIIVDEGHSFASSGSKSNAVLVAGSLQVERRWIVSGTPTKGLMGVEVELAANETPVLGAATLTSKVDSTSDSRVSVLESRKVHAGGFYERNDLEKLGRIAVDYLKLRPWANSQRDDPPPSWMKHMCCVDKNGSFLGYSPCLRNVLQAMIIKTRPEDVEKDLELPPLYNRLVYLEPSFYDKLSLNLFAMVLNVNAITSEREDEDYLFHTKNRKALHQLITNLRQSGFFWSGFSEADILKSVKVAKAYRDEKAVGDYPDYRLLQDCISTGECAVGSLGWKAFGRFHELGIFVNAFPVRAAKEWALDEGQTEQLLAGMTQLIAAQNFVNEQLYAPDPGAGLTDAGKNVMNESRKLASVVKGSSGVTEKAVPASSVIEAPLTIEKRTMSPKGKLSDAGKGSQSKSPLQAPSVGLKSVIKRSRTIQSDLELAADSDLLKTAIVGTASSKLSYLIDRIVGLHKDEKILIFYEGDNIAYYIAQALELLDVKFLIYAKSLPAARRAAYVVTFNTTETFRVLLMDVHQAAHGLNISSASRVFFVNAIWQPSVEAQAIKRAHRIGQMRPVYVETLVLSNSLEDRMLQRRKAMSNHEHQQAEKSLLNDTAMSSIIKGITFLQVSPTDGVGHRQMAPLEKPQQVFARPSRGGAMPNDPDADLVAIFESTPPKAKRSAKSRDAVTSPFMSFNETSSPRNQEMLAFDRADASADTVMEEAAISMASTTKHIRSKPGNSLAKTSLDAVHGETGPGSSNAGPPSTPIRRARFSLPGGDMELTGDDRASGLSDTAFLSPQTPTPSSSIFGGPLNLAQQSKFDQCRRS
ncbi:MAG: hypothetical protein M1812_004995 [Candelaria pacifica]|nr:MAG: hypothetical protein M1812_004995 [Candelaria pacifica]